MDEHNSSTHGLELSQNTKNHLSHSVIGLPLLMLLVTNRHEEN